MSMKALLNHPWHRWVLAMIVLVALNLRYEGLTRPIIMHSDEIDITNWMEDTRLKGHLNNITYPAGFFTIAEAARSACEIVWFRPMQRFLYHTGVINRLETHLPSFTFARHLNVWLGALTVLLIYLLCLCVSGSRGASLFGAALFTFAPFHIEHSHYLETDIATVAMLTLALWLWARHARTPRWRTFAAAAIATGFAVGTKTTVVFLAPLVVFFSRGWVDDACPAPPLWRDRRMMMRVVAGMALVGLGFFWSTPEALNIGRYLADYRHMIKAVYIETPGILGAAYDQPWARQLLLFHNFRIYLGLVGSGWLLAAAAGLPLLFAPGSRRFWPVTLLFPALFLYFFLIQAPWVRTQEFMNFLPSFAVAAAVAAAWLLERARCSRRSAASRTAVTALLLALLVPTAQLGFAAASRCGWTDTRDLARSWLMRQLPTAAMIAGEILTPPSTFKVTRSELPWYHLQKVESQGLPLLLEKGVSYLIRNASLSGRGQNDPRTGRMYPSHQAKYDAFLRGAERLRVWSAFEPERPTIAFRSPLLELWGLRAPVTGPALELALPQPLFVSTTGRETFFPTGHTLGAAEGVLIDRHGREIAVGGEEAPQGPVFVIVNTLGLPAQVHVSGFGRSRTAELQPFDAAAIPLRRPWWSPRFGSYERIRAWTKAQAHVEHLPCWLRVAFDATEAASVLAELGRPDRAWALLEANGGGRDPGLALRIAVEAGRMAEAARLEPAATAQLEQTEKILRGETTSWRLNGFSATRYEEFARWRAGAPDEVAALGLTEREGRAAGAPPMPIEAVQEVPLRLAGPGTLRMQVRVRGEEHSRDGEKPKSDTDLLELRDQSERLLYSGPWSDIAGPEFHQINLPIEAAARERSIVLRWSGPRARVLEIRNLEAVWLLDDVLKARVRANRIALARLHLSRGAAAAALAVRAGILEPGPREFDLDLRRLDLELAQAGAKPIEQAARRLLELAPRHYAALRALAVDDPQHASAAAALEGGGEAFVFGRLAAIRSARIVDGRLRLVIEALSDDTPALFVEVREKKFNRWKRRDRVVFSSPRALHAGERIAVELPTGGVKLSRLGVSVTDDNPHVRSELLVRDEAVVRLADLLPAASRGE